jgi:hypothetical protein
MFAKQRATSAHRCTRATPSTTGTGLVQDEKSIFTSLVNNSGANAAAQLRNHARVSYSIAKNAAKLEGLSARSPPISLNSNVSVDVFQTAMTPRTAAAQGLSPVSSPRRNNYEDVEEPPSSGGGYGTRLSILRALNHHEVPNSRGSQLHEGSGSLRSSTELLGELFMFNNAMAKDGESSMESSTMKL